MTAPLSATAIPRWATSTAFSSRRAASVAATSGSSSPLIRIWASAVACVMCELLMLRIAHGADAILLRGLGRREPLDAERPDGRIERALEYEARDRVGRHRCAHDAVAVVAGGIADPVKRRRPEDRGIVAAARPVADPHFIDR